MVLTRSFFARPAAELAPDLLGCRLRHRLPDGRILSCIVVETEAYAGADDLACHAARGRTPRNEPLFGPAGKAYVYLVYGMHHLLNAVAAGQGDPQAVLVRAARWEVQVPGAPSLSGPGRLGKGLGIRVETHDRCDLCGGGPLWFEPRPPEFPGEIATSRRIGVDYAGTWRAAPLRFYLRGEPAVSGPASLRG